MNLEHLVYDKSDGIATVRLNRPENLNAFTPLMREGFAQAFEDAEGDDEVRVVILTGAGEAFSAKGSENPPREATGARKIKLPPPLSREATIIRKLTKPVIAAVNGAAEGAGFNLTLVCDFRVASESARFGDLHLGTGSIPALGAFMLPRLIGLSQATRLLMLPETITAREAEGLGLVYKVVPEDELMGCARELAGRLMVVDPMLLQLTKRTISKSVEENLDSVLEYVLFARSTTKSLMRELEKGK